MNILCYTQGKFQDLRSRSRGTAVAAFHFGPIILGDAFSRKSEWSEVEVYLPKNDEYFVKSKVPTTLLLNPDQSFRAFGYETEKIFFNSESDDGAVNFRKENRHYYYFKNPTKFLHDKDVSKFITCTKLQSVPCNYTCSMLQNF